ncbi:Protein kinase domain-containing protein [Abeliophyllum distichum]|uniref:Protein kinase domain-containing protein n=1 Tax=Abeliophyllum distichum TaxID=126358 RepID=A0ABD1RUU3_9LAMI
MSAKRTRGERLPSPSSSEEEDPQTKRFDRCPVLIGKNVDLGSFTFDAPFFHIEDLFVGMGWVGILTIDDKSLYPPRLFLTSRGEYDLVAACCRVTEKYFDAPTRLSTNQLTLTCRVLHNIIAHIIVPRKGHHDEVNHYDVFLLDSILFGRKLDFSYIMIQHMNSVLSGQWVAKSKGFDDESGPSTLPFEGEDMDADEDAPPPSPPRPRSHQPSSSTSGFNDDHFNLLNGQIDSFTSTVDGMQLAVNDLHNTTTTIQSDD